MFSQVRGYRRVAFIFWVLTCIAIAIWSQVPGYVVGWDLDVYAAAIRSLRLGHDPYADGIAIQRIFHAETVHTSSGVPFTYVYSPMTLPLLRLIGHLPFLFSATIYWLFYIACSAAAIWVGMQLVQPSEKKVLALLAPVAIFFPGLVQNDVLFSGNVAYILHGIVLLTAWLGWKRGRWSWFYVAVLAASCLKAPLLTLLALPVLSARRQWIPACLTGAAGVFLFALQPRIWPQLFAHYLTAVELQFSFNHDFSSSPAGLLADALYDVIPYRVTSIGFYLFYAIPFFIVLLMLRRRYLAGRLSIQQWAPLQLIGVLLMNPRIMEYDIAPLTIPMALVAWRLAMRVGRQKTRDAVVILALFFGAANSFPALQWRPVDCLVIVTLFFGGCWDLFLTAEEQCAAEAPTIFNRAALGATETVAPV